MNLPEGISDRELIEHLFGRIETLEGSLRAALDLAMAAALALPRETHANFRAHMAGLQADRLAAIDTISGQYIRPLSALQTNQRNGYNGQVRDAESTLTSYGLG